MATLYFLNRIESIVENEKLLIICRNVYRSHIMQVYQKLSVCGKRLKTWYHLIITSPLLSVCLCVILWAYWLTLSHIQQLCSRRLWKHVPINEEKISIKESVIIEWGWKHWQMEKLFVMSNLSICQNVFKNCLLHRRQKASISEKGLNLQSTHWQLTCISKNCLRLEK